MLLSGLPVEKLQLQLQLQLRGPFIVLKPHKCLLARDTRLLADGIVDVHTMRREHLI